MPPPIVAALHLRAALLVAMVRIIGRINGHSDAAVMLSVDTTDDPVEARRTLVNDGGQAAELRGHLRVHRGRADLSDWRRARQHRIA